MNYLEYTVEFQINEETEKKTKEVMNVVKEGRCGFNFIMSMIKKREHLLLHQHQIFLNIYFIYSMEL